MQELSTTTSGIRKHNCHARRNSGGQGIGLRNLCSVRCAMEHAVVFRAHAVKSKIGRRRKHRKLPRSCGHGDCRSAPLLRFLYKTPHRSWDMNKEMGGWRWAVNLNSFPVLMMTLMKILMNDFHCDRWELRHLFTQRRCIVYPYLFLSLSRREPVSKVTCHDRKAHWMVKKGLQSQTQKNTGGRRSVERAGQSSNDKWKGSKKTGQMEGSFP